MKAIIKITALLVCLLFVFAASGCARETDPAKIVVADVAGEKIYRSEVDSSFAQMVSMYAQFGMPVDETDEKQVAEIKNDLLDSLVTGKILKVKAKELGYTNLSKEKQDEVIKSMDEQLQGLKDQIKTAVEEEAKTNTAIKVDEEVAKQYNDQLKQAGFTEESYKQYMLEQASAEEMTKAIKDKITVSEEEIKKWYDDNLKSQQEEIKATPSSYESYDAQDIALYIPEGIIRVLQILIKLPDDKTETAQTLYNDDKKEDAMNMLRPHLDAIKPKAEEVLAKVKAGEDFSALVTQYNEDPGMKEEPAKTEGYMVIPGNTTYLSEFNDAALKLKNVGDTSDLVETIFGYHILKNIGTVTPGAVPYDSVKEKVKENALTEKQDSEWTKQQEAWKKELEPKIKLYKNKMFEKIETPKTSESPSASASAENS